MVLLSNGGRQEINKHMCPGDRLQRTLQRVRMEVTGWGELLSWKGKASLRS